MSSVARKMFLPAAVMALSAWTLAAFAATPPTHVGYAAKVQKDVEGRLGEAAPQLIAIEDDIFFTQLLTTRPDATAIIVFRDGSSLEVGPSSALTIDEFVFNPTQGVKQQTISAIVGSFRFVSGMAMPKQRITLNTPTATIGIRGSVNELVVGGDGSTASVPTAGSATMAPRNNPGAAINIQRGSAGVQAPGRPPATGPQFNAVARQVTSRNRQNFGARPVLPAPSPQRVSKDTQANLQPPAVQQPPAAPTPAVQQAIQQISQDLASANATDLVIPALPQLVATGVVDQVGAVLAQDPNADPSAVPLAADQQDAVTTLDTQTSALQGDLDAGLQDGQAASEAAHQAGTANVIGGIAQTGDTDAVLSATGNAAEGDPAQAADAVGAAAANLPAVDADVAANLVQSAANGLGATGQVLDASTLGSLTATMLVNVDPTARDAISNDVVTRVANNNNVDVNEMNDAVNVTTVALLSPAAGSDTDADADDPDADADDPDADIDDPDADVDDADADVDDPDADAGDEGTDDDAQQVAAVEPEAGDDADDGPTTTTTAPGDDAPGAESENPSQSSPTTP